MTNKNTEQEGRKPHVLCICDGWGVREEKEHNAIALAHTPNWDRILKNYPHTTIGTSGTDVGLPEGQMGNSEVGHMSIGSGRIILQDLPRIDRAIQDNQFVSMSALTSFMGKVVKENGAFHVAGLLSPGGVHAHERHLHHVLAILAPLERPIYVHGFLDGRDTAPTSAIDSVKKLLAIIEPHANIMLASLAGRYYAMDRDKRFERTEKAYRAMVHADGEKISDWCERIQRAYDDGITDEFMTPLLDSDYPGMSDGDGFFFTNFRADRARQIMHALVMPEWEHFSRGKAIHFSDVLGMMPYDDLLKPYMHVLFGSDSVPKTLAEIMEAEGKTQLRIAETEKYAHVTFFFSGGREKEFEGETRVLIPSPKVATYDLQPEMSAYRLTERIVQEIHSGRHDLIIVNFANPDMVGHTGKLDAAILSVEAMDRCFGELENAVLATGGVMMITADHGNIEMMHDVDTDKPCTSHTMNPVPCVIVGEGMSHLAMRKGRLADVAPTMLELMGIEKPEEMTGASLIDL